MCSRMACLFQGYNVIQDCNGMLVQSLLLFYQFKNTMQKKKIKQVQKFLLRGKSKTFGKFLNNHIQLLIPIIRPSSFILLPSYNFGQFFKLCLIWVACMNNSYLYCDYSMSTPPKSPQKNACPTNQENQEDNQSAASLHFDLLTLHDRKASYDSELPSLRESESCFPEDSKEQEKGKKGKGIQKKQRDGEVDRKISLSKKRRIVHLENRVEELEREVASLRRNEHYYCLSCRSRLPEYCRQRFETPIHPEESGANVAGQADAKKGSKDSLEFQKIDFNAPLVQSQEMEEKLWIFVGTMLIAMGSKVTDFDGTINIFKVLKQSVDKIRRQVEKCEPKIGLQFYCCKQEMNEPQNFIDGMIFDPFFSQKHEMSLGHFSLDGIKLESVEEYELFYDSKYNFHIKYDALLSIIQYARDNCSIS